MNKKKTIKWQRRAARHRRQNIAEGDGEHRNWADLPADLLSIVFRKLSVFDVLLRKQWVCRHWRTTSHNPSIWRVVDMRGCSSGAPQQEQWSTAAGAEDTVCVEKVAREAINRAGGCLEEYYGDFCGSDDLLSYIAERTSTLRCLGLISCYDVSDDGLLDFARRSPMLEELEITFSTLSGRLYESLGQLCPQLKHLCLNTTWVKLFSDETVHIFDDVDALAIANTMHQLRSLQLIGSQLSNEGLVAIIDNCPQLESLDIRCCYNVKMDKILVLKLGRIKNVRLPHDSTEDYEYPADEDDFAERQSPFFDYDYISEAGDFAEFDGDFAEFDDLFLRQ